MCYSRGSAFHYHCVQHIPIVMSLLCTVTLELVYLRVEHAVEHLIMSEGIRGLVILLRKITKVKILPT